MQLFDWSNIITRCSVQYFQLSILRILTYIHPLSGYQLPQTHTTLSQVHIGRTHNSRPISIVRGRTRGGGSEV